MTSSPFASRYFSEVMCGMSGAEDFACELVWALAENAKDRVTIVRTTVVIRRIAFDPLVGVSGGLSTMTVFGQTSTSFFDPFGRCLVGGREKKEPGNVCRALFPRQVRRQSVLA